MSKSVSKLVNRLTNEQAESVAVTFACFSEGEDAPMQDIQVCIDLNLLRRPDPTKRYWEFNKLGDAVANELQDRYEKQPNASALRNLSGGE